MTYKIDKRYWNPRRILGYNCKWNLVGSDRGRGKTYNTIPMMLAHPGQTQFMSITRSTEDLRYAVKNDWVDWPIRLGLDESLIEWEKSNSFANLFYDGEPWGYFRALSMVDHIKHEEFPKTTNWAMFDEFIPLAWKKLPGVSSEGEALETIIDTIDHDSVERRTAAGLKPLRVLMYCNPFTWNNPILRYFGVTPLGFGIHRIQNGLEGGTVFEHLEPLDSQQGVRRQEGYLKELAFIGAIPKGAVPIWSIRFGSDYYVAYSKGGDTVWITDADRHMEITAPGNVKYGTYDGLQVQEMPISKVRIKMLTEWTRSGRFIFDTVNVKFGWQTNIEVYKQG